MQGKNNMKGDGLQAALTELAKRQSELEKWALHQQMENQRLFTQLAQRQMAFDERMSRNDERWLDLARKMDQIILVQAQHSEILEKLPETIRQKIGFEATS